MSKTLYILVEDDVITTLDDVEQRGSKFNPTYPTLTPEERVKLMEQFKKGFSCMDEVRFSVIEIRNGLIRERNLSQKKQ